MLLPNQYIYFQVNEEHLIIQEMVLMFNDI